MTIILRQTLSISNGYGNLPIHLLASLKDPHKNPNDDNDNPTLLSSIESLIITNTDKKLLHSAFNNDGQTACQMAIAAGKSELMAMLLKHDTDPKKALSHQDNNGYNSIVYAARQSNDMLKTILYILHIRKKSMIRR